MNNTVINETLAKRNNDNYSFSDYKEGSATAEYNTVIAEATEKIKNAKTTVSAEAQIRLDNLLNKFKSSYANWINKHNANGANHVSWMIAGPSNYNMKKHNRYMASEGKLWAEYNEIMDIDSKIHKIIAGDKIIKSDDSNALDKLKAKLEAALKEHEGYKEYNKNARKEGKAKLPAYMLSNSNQRMRQIKQRIAKLEKLEQEREIAKEEGNEEIDINGIKIIDNVGANRIQIFFGFKPDYEVRAKLKKHGFHFSKSNNDAWQRFRSNEALRIAKQIVNEL